MATRSTIWLRTENEEYTYKGSYCHFDGGIKVNGKLLFENYNTKEKIEELISFGQMSSLGPTPNDCFFYARDGGENISTYKLLTNENDITSHKDIDRYFEEYNYVFENNTWYVYTINYKNGFELIKNELQTLLDI